VKKKFISNDKKETKIIWIIDWNYREKI